MKKILHLLIQDKKAGAEQVVLHLVESEAMAKHFDSRVFLISKPWSTDSKTFGKNTVSLIDVLFTKWDIVHSHLFWGGFFARLLTLFHWRTTWIHSLHYASYKTQKWSLLKQLVDKHLVFPKADVLHLVSESCRPIVAEFLNPILIENDIVTFADHLKSEQIDVAFAQKRNKYATQNFKLNLLTVGFFRQEKGFERVLKTAEFLKKSRLNFIWKICGDGPLLAHFKKQVKEMDLEDVLSCVGYTDQLQNYYLEADVYIQTSYIESFGLAVRDALKSNLPVMVSGVDYMTKLLEEGRHGTLIESNEFFEENLANEIISFYKTCKEAQSPYFEKTLTAYAQHQAQKISSLNKDSFIQKWLSCYQSKKLLFISPITTQATGGIQKQLHLQTQQLAREGFRITLLQRKDYTLSGKPDLKQKWSHVTFRNCHYIPMIDHWDWGQRVNGLLFLIQGFFHLLKIGKIDVVHSLQIYSPAMLGVVAKYINHCPLVVKVTASGEFGELNQIKKLPFSSLRKVFLRRVDKFLALTESMKFELMDYGFVEKNIVVIPNSVEVFPAANLMRGSHFRILYTGRISIEKSLETLLVASLQLARANSQLHFQLDIVGTVYKSRNNFSELEKIAKQAPDNLKITFWGHQNQVKSFYENAHIFVLPSISEGMSNALLEAMSYGLPCVVSDIAANRAIITDKVNGVFFKVANVEDLKDKLTLMVFDFLNNDYKFSSQLGLSAQNLIQKNYSVNKVCEKIVESYQIK